eukprot:7279604-Prorocentrum_lima.AAC.1
MGIVPPVILPLDYSLDAQLAALVARPGEDLPRSRDGRGTGYTPGVAASSGCLLYTSDAADDMQ